MLEGVSHTFLKERRLQPSPAHLGNCGRTGEHSYSVVDPKRGRGAGFPFKFGQKARTLLARRGNSASFQNKIEKFRMFVCPGLCAHVGPELRFFRLRNPHSYCVTGLSRGLLQPAET